jgi:oligoendopeptidase F
MEKQRKRNEIEEKYTWDLTTIFESDEKWYEELEKVSKEVKEIEKYKGNITTSAKNLLDFLRFDEKLDRKMNKLYYYAHLKHDQDTTNTTYQTLVGKISNLFKEYNELAAFVIPEMLKKDYSDVLEYIKDEKELEEYAFSLEKIYRYKEHTLSEPEEKILSSLSKALGIADDAYTSLTDSDLKFGMIKDEDGKEIEFTESNYSKFITSKDRNVRKNAFEMMFNTYSKYKNTLATTFSGNVEYLTSIAKIKKYNSSIEAALFDDNIDTKVYDNVVNTVNNNLKTIYKYFDLKKEVLGLDEIHLYDIYAELVNDLDKKYSFEEAKELVFKAVEPLGEEYSKILNKAFDERWIDVYNNEGKRGGAYSSGFYDTNPFVLLNYEGKLNDVSTLAHELGHSMHTYLSCHNNSYTNSNYKIFVAEVASTTNELFLCKYLLKTSSDKKEKMYVLNRMMELFKGTIFRQAMFAEFERDMHALKEKGEILTNELLCDEYYKLNQKYFGKNVVVDDLIKYEWERIPHFYYNFYVYKYCIGLSCASYIVTNILEGKENALENYIKFLSSGGSDYPANELKIAGIDITKSDVIESAIKMFDETIDEFKRLYEE